MKQVTIFICLVLAVTKTFTLEPPGCAPGPPPPCRSPNEWSTPCGNKCELTCDNIGERVDHKDIADTSEGCIYGCYCKPGYIRDDTGTCVLQQPDTCDFNPCENRPNSLWSRCALNRGSTCYKRDCKCPDRWESQCVCKPGFSLNLKNQCIKANSRACKQLSKKSACI